MSEKKEPRQWLANLDSELVIKNLLFGFIFLCLVIFGINYLLLPMMKEYKIAINEQNKNKVVLNVVNNKFNSVQGGFTVFFNENKTLLNALHYQITSENLQIFLEHFFVKVKVVQKASEMDKDMNLLKTDFDVEVVAKDLQAIQNFFDAIKDAPMNMKVVVPFAIKKQDNALVVSFVVQNKYSSQNY